jgi:hypothetical protein
MKTPKIMRLLGAAALVAFASLSASAATINVNSISSLQSAINGAVAGDIIIMQSGTYTTSSAITVNRVGTASNPITISAGTIGGVTIQGTHGFVFSSPAAYIEIEGFRFLHANSINIPVGTHHIRLTRNFIDLNIASGADVSYINISGDDVEIDRNEFANKNTLGNMLDITGTGGQVARRLWVHHNYFHDFVSAGGNGAETIRWGLSGLSLSTGNGICEYNLFVRCNGENEMISNKSSGNIFRFNTVIDGNEMSQRHGDNCQWYGNYMLNSEGIRIYGDNHLIHSNYLEGNTKGIDIGNGDGDVHNGAPLTAHDRPDGCIIVFNTLINNNTQYQMGGRTNGLGATSTTFANNILQGGTTAVSISSSAPYTNPTWSGNIIWSPTNIGNIPTSGYSNVNPLLAADAQGILHLQSGSPAIGTATGTYSGVTIDMDGQPRPSTGKDKGADESSTATVTAKLLTPADVGPQSGLSAPTAAPAFNPAGGTYTSAQTVTITSSTSGASIRYTINGTTPTATTGTLYSGPVNISTTTTLRAIAFKSGNTDSTVTTATYTINTTGGGTTITPTNGFVNVALSAIQTGSFTATVDAQPSTSPANQVVGLSSGAATGYTSMAVMARFNTTGTIDARNGGGFTSGTIPFSANVKYTFRFVVNVATRTYSAYVRAAGGSEQTIGTNLAFRTEQAGVTSLSHATFNVNATPGGSLTYWPVVITGTVTPAKLSIPGTSVTASAHDGNVPANTVDGSTATRWSASGDPQWIQYDLGSTKTVSFIKIAWYSGDTRSTTFDIQVASSPTGPFTNIATGLVSSGTSIALEQYELPDTNIRYVRIVGHGNSSNAWNSISETEIWGF